jgi:molybdopterin molybdotransferase
LRGNIQGIGRPAVLKGELLIDLEEAFRIVASVPPEGRTEAVSLEEALGRVLPAPVAGTIDSPPFDKSAMDGYAVVLDDDSPSFRVLDTVAAGGLPARGVRRGECMRIMTGAMLPDGAGRVIRREYAEETDGVVRQTRPEPGDNVIRRASSLSAGEAVLEPRVLAARDIGILAASGIPRVTVSVPPRAAILCTGNEIREPGQPLAPGQIYNSNGPQLRAQLAAMHCPGAAPLSVEDRPGPLAAAIDRACRTSGLLLLTGGVSAGDFDYVPQCLQDQGAEILFHGVAVKPGKPSLFARRGETYVFGLPGNPVSTFVIFELFVKPFLYRRMGLAWEPPSLRVVLSQAWRRRVADRTEFHPVRVKDGRATPLAFHGSSHLNALGDADALMRVEKGVSEVAEGATIDVRPL